MAKKSYHFWKAGNKINRGFGVSKDVKYNVYDAVALVRSLLGEYNLPIEIKNNDSFGMFEKGAGVGVVSGAVTLFPDVVQGHSGVPFFFLEGLFFIPALTDPCRFAAPMDQPGNSGKDDGSSCHEGNVEFRIAHRQIGGREKACGKGEADASKTHKGHQPDAEPASRHTVGAGHIRGGVTQSQRRKVHQDVHDDVESHRHGGKDEKRHIHIVHDEVTAPQHRDDQRLDQQDGVRGIVTVDRTQSRRQFPFVGCAEKSFAGTCDP